MKMKFNFHYYFFYIIMDIQIRTVKYSEISKPTVISPSNIVSMNKRERSIQRIDQFLKNAWENGVKRSDLFKVALLVAKVACVSILIIAAVLFTALSGRQLSKHFGLRSPLLGPLLGLACITNRRIK